MNKNLLFPATDVQKSFPSCMVIHLSNYSHLQYVHSNVLKAKIYLKYFIRCLSVFFTWPLSSQRNNAEDPSMHCCICE